MVTLPFLIILLLYAGPAGPDSLETAINRVAPSLSQYVAPIDTQRHATRHAMMC